MESTWCSRDLPVLEMVILFIEENPHDLTMPTAVEIAEAEGRSLDEVLLALRALDGEYLELDEIAGDRGKTSVRRILPSARRVVSPLSEE